jgi:hypothetical protein
VHELEHHLRRADLGRVDRRRDREHGLALLEDLVALGVGRRAALEVQLPLELLVAIQVLQRLAARDLERDERIAVRRLAQLAEADAIARARHELHVVDDPVPPRELVVAADAEAEVLVRRLQGRRLRARAEAERHEAGDEQNVSPGHAHRGSGVGGTARLCSV